MGQAIDPSHVLFLRCSSSIARAIIWAAEGSGGDGGKGKATGLFDIVVVAGLGDDPAYTAEIDFLGEKIDVAAVDTDVDECSVEVGESGSSRWIGKGVGDAGGVRRGATVESGGAERSR